MYQVLEMHGMYQLTNQTDSGSVIVKVTLSRQTYMGNQPLKIHPSWGTQGNHTATQDGDLIYTDEDKKVIYRITPDRKVTEIIKPGDWKPFSIHSSSINGDILVGMIKDKTAKITRYSKAGKEIQNMRKDKQGQGLYRYPRYITENINGDICTSDFNIRSSGGE